MHQIDALLTSRAEKRSHKETSERLVPPAELYAWAAKNGVTFNLFHDNVWEPHQGAILWRMNETPADRTSDYAVKTKDGKHMVPVAFVRHAEWRLHPERLLTEADITRIVIPQKAGTGLQTIETGREEELMVVPNGLRGDRLQKSLDQFGVSTTPELLKIPLAMVLTPCT